MFTRSAIMRRALTGFRLSTSEAEHCLGMAAETLGNTIRHCRRLHTTGKVYVTTGYRQPVSCPEATASPANTLGHCRSIHTSGRKRKFRLTYDTLNKHVLKMEYAVRGQIPQEARRIEKAIKKGDKRYPFDRVVHCNIGDCHAMGQRPLTFVRQLLSACANPTQLLDDASYPADVLGRAIEILQNCSGNSIGSYSESHGIEIIRKHIAEFISQRDGVPCSYKNIYLVNGASEGIKTMLYVVMGDECSSTKTGVMIPTPQYPLYSAALAELSAQSINYMLNEDKNWAIDVPGLRGNLQEARKHCDPRIMVVINPGNPTGQYLPTENVRDIIRFCHEEGLMLFTDEVYQENIYEEGAMFQSFYKVLHDMGPEFSDVQIISFNSTSKGYFGECGIRGGYMQLVGLDDRVMEQIYKHVSVSLCPNTPGQIVTDALVNPPKRGEPSYDLYAQEKAAVLDSLSRKAKMVYERMNQITGVTCNEVQGAMYAFPRVNIPEEAWEDAQRENPEMKLDFYYCLELLRQTGVCVVPGSGFGQKEGTWHFRTTILPSENDLHYILDQFEHFHINFLRKYGKL